MTIGLPAKALLEQVHLVGDVVHRHLHVHALPVRQHVNGDVVDVVGEFRVSNPHVPRFGRADRLAGRCPDAIEVRNEVADGKITTQHDFIADDDARDVLVAVCEPDCALDLSLVADPVAAEPRADRGREPVSGSERWNLAQRAEDAVAANGLCLSSQHREVTIDFLHRRQVAGDGILVLLERLEREPTDLRGPCRFRRGPVRIAPDGDSQHGESRRDQQARGLIHADTPNSLNSKEGA